MSDDELLARTNDMFTELANNMAKVRDEVLLEMLSQYGFNGFPTEEELAQLGYELVMTEEDNVTTYKLYKVVDQRKIRLDYIFKIDEAEKAPTQQDKEQS